MPDELKELLKKPIEAVGTVEIVAAQGEDGKPDANGNKKMAIAAYNGGLMNVGWGAPVGIELSGLAWREDNAVPVLCQHRTYSIDSICGQATKVKIDGNSLKIDADFMPVSQDAKKVYTGVTAGVLRMKDQVLKDVTNLRENCEDIVARYGTIDILLNAAGGNMPAATVPPDKTIFDLDIDAFRKVVDLNLFGTIIPTTVFARVMVKNGKGSIINFCSMTTLRPLTRVAGYGAAKAAVGNWTQYLAGEMALKFGDGLRVNAIAPGFLLTNQNRSLLTNPDGSLTPRSHSILGHTPFGRFLEPDELVGCLHYLASDASKGVTGTINVVDGGFAAFSI